MNKALAGVQPHKLVILIICFGLTSILIYRAPTSNPVKKQMPLAQALSNINGWAVNGNTPLNPNIIKALDLDDYVNHTYSNGNNTISLYIGYYLTTTKVGAAHSPLVCFPGQGWVLSNEKQRAVAVGKRHIHVTSMAVNRGDARELVIYWFQAGNKTSPGTFLQKLHGLQNKLFEGREDNAFVRISAPLNNTSEKEAFALITDFIGAFYPRFLWYINQDLTEP
jgi:EpsI family protein